MAHTPKGKWELEAMDNWPACLQLNAFGCDGYFDGGTDGDGILDRLPPNPHSIQTVSCLDLDCRLRDPRSDTSAWWFVRCRRDRVWSAALDPHFHRYSCRPHIRVVLLWGQVQAVRCQAFQGDETASRLSALWLGRRRRRGKVTPSARGSALNTARSRDHRLAGRPENRGLDCHPPSNTRSSVGNSSSRSEVSASCQV